MAKCKKLICFALLCTIAASAIQATAVAQEQVTIHMSLSGTEQGDGSKEKPVNSLASALRLVRSKYVKEDEVTIEIEGGTYEINSIINLNEETLDRFNGQLNIKARDGEEVWFSGSTKIDINDFKPVTDTEIIKRLPKESASNIGVLDLTKYGFTKETLHPTYGKTTYYSGVNYLDLRLNERKELIARYPNTGTVPYGKIIRKEVPDSFPDRVSDKSRFDSVNIGDGVTAIFEFDNPRIERWEHARDAYMYGYVYVDYEADRSKVRKFDLDERTIELDNRLVYGIKGNRYIYVENLLEEIDIPGEYYVDWREQKLYYYPSHKLSSDDTLEIFTMRDTMLSIDGVNNISFQGIGIKNGLSQGVEITSSSNVNFDKCKIANMSSRGIYATEYTNGKIENCDIYNTGGVGIYIESSGDKLNLTPGNVTIYNNHLFRVSNTGSGGWNGGIRLGAKCIGAKVLNNVIHDSVAMPITYEGNDNYIAYNEIYNTIRKTADQGAIYTGRNFTLYGNAVEYNYLHDNTNPNASQYGSVGYYIDDWCTGQVFKHNIVHMGKKKHTTAMGTHSKHTTIQYNIAYEAEMGLALGDRSGSVPNVLTMSSFPAYTLTNGANVGISPKDFWSKGVWKERFPQISEIMPQVNADEGYFLRDGNVLTDNVCVDAPINITNPQTATGCTIERNLDINDTSIFVDVDNHDFRLTMEAVEKYNLSPEIINEQNFSMDQIGIQTKDRDLDAKIGDFGLLYPQNGATAIQRENFILKWETALFADEYEYVVAKDKELTEIVATGTVYDNTVQVDGLENNTIYYWTVKAKQIGKQIKGEKECDSGIFSFKIAKYDELYTDGLKESINELKLLTSTITEGTEIGEFKKGTAEKINKEIEAAETLVNSTYGFQSTIEDTNAKLSSIIDGIGGYKIKGYQTFNISGTDAFAAKNAETIITEENGIWTGSLEDANMGNIAYAGTPENHKVLEFKIKAERREGSNDWMGITLRQSNPQSEVYSSSSSSYLVVAKDDIFELQKYHPGASKTGIIMTAPNNGEFMFGQWNDVTFGAVDVEGGVEILFKVGDNIIFDWYDSETPNFETGSFVVRPPGKGAAISLAAADNPSVGEYIPDSSIFETVAESSMVYTTKDSFYKETGEWSDFSAEAYEGNTVRVSTGGEAVWETQVEKSVYDVYYWHTPLANGDKNAKVTFFTQTPQGGNREFTVRVNFSTGEAGWRKIGSFETLSFGGGDVLGVKITGSGNGVVPVSAIKSVKSDDNAKKFTEAFYESGSNVIALQIGSYRVFESTAEKAIEQSPVIENDRTLVPIRVIAEYFGFDVTWNEAERTVLLQNAENSVMITIDMSTYLVNGMEKSLDTPAVIRNGKTILPLRAIVEGIGKAICWDDNQKLVLIGDTLSLDSKTDSEKREIFDTIGQGFKK